LEETWDQAVPARRPPAGELGGRPLDERLAGAPISWGACEVPGWGAMPSADRVLAEMAELGLRGTELGAPGFLPRDAAALGASLAGHSLALVGAFTALVLHEPAIDAALEEVRNTARLFAEVGGDVIVLAVISDRRWSSARDLEADEWRRLRANIARIASELGERGIALALHPHWGTLIQTAEQVERALELLDVGWCLDTGHLLLGGVDPAEFARDHGDRVVHVHLKDVDASLAAALRAGRATLLSATRQGLFLPLGRGDAGIGAVLSALNEHEYGRWLVLEQDTAITGDEPDGDRVPLRDARQSIAFVKNPAPRTQEVNL
jgi:inosose dehydratase